MWRRLSPVLSLFFLAPLIAEYLLGSLPMSLIGILPLMAFMYGSGAILIRDFVRGSGRGWASIVLLATAYGFIEEGLITQSLFNPDYLHLRLLDFGFLPALGTGLPWLIFVISIHVIWSICVPIGLTETLFKGRREAPWLGGIGRTVFALLFLLGSVMVAGFSFKQGHFMATPAQLAMTGVVVLALIVAAVVWPKPQPARGGTAPHPVVLFLVSFISGSALQLIQHAAQNPLHWSWPVCVASVLGLEILFVAYLMRFTGGRVWSDLQRFSLMAGGMCVYIWVGFGTDVSLHGVADLPAHAVIAGLFIAITLWAGFIAVKPAGGALPATEASAL